jgi:hypothetical protein
VAFDKTQILILRQFNACLYLEMMNSFLIEYNPDTYEAFFELSFKSLQFGEMEFSFELLTRILLTYEGLDLFSKENIFLINIKRMLVEVANQETKKKILGIIELALCSKKIKLSTQIVSDHFSSLSYLTVMYFFFFNSVEHKIDIGNSGLGLV